MEEVSAFRLVTFCSCFDFIGTDFEVFKQATMDDSPNGLLLTSSDLTDTIRNTYRYINWVFLLKIPDGNFVNRLLDKSLSRNKNQIILNICFKNYIILINLDSQTSKKAQ